MPDLFIDDIEDQKTYTDEMILQDVRALIKTGQREGTIIDYKKDISEDWPETAAAFLNTFGGLIVFGVEGKGDHPHRMCAFDPRGVEIRAKLTNMLLSQIQPRPDFQVRVVTFDDDPSKEIAILRVSEGLRPPYMHSTDRRHRVYVRVGEQKAEADYLQLSALFEKRVKTESQLTWRPSVFDELTSKLYVMRPEDPNFRSEQFYSFIVTPNDERAARALTGESERQFEECLEHVYRGFERPLRRQSVDRSHRETYCRRGNGLGGEQRFGVGADGSLGFVTHACAKTSTELLFSPFRFCRDLVEFLSLSALFYERRRYFGGLHLHAKIVFPEKGASVLAIHPDPRMEKLFEPPFERISGNWNANIRMVLHPITGERLHEYVDAALHDLARTTGSVLSPSFPEAVQPLIEDALKRSRGAS